MRSLSLHRHVYLPALIAGTLLLAAARLAAAPIVVPYQVAGDLQLQQSGNEITGHYQLNLPAPEPGNSDFMPVKSGNRITGDFTLSQTGNEITGSYQIASATGPTVPEPAGVPLFAAGAGLVAFSRMLKWRRTARSARVITV